MSGRFAPTLLKIAAALAAAIAPWPASAQAEPLTADPDALCMFASAIFLGDTQGAAQQSYGMYFGHFRAIVGERYQSAGDLAAALAAAQKQLNQNNVEVVFEGCRAREAQQVGRLDDAMGLPRE